MKKRRNLAGIVNKNNNKMRVLEVVQSKINSDKKMKKKWDEKMKKQESKKTEKKEENK